MCVYGSYIVLSLTVRWPGRLPVCPPDRLPARLPVALDVLTCVFVYFKLFLKRCIVPYVLNGNLIEVFSMSCILLQLFAAWSLFIGCVVYFVLIIWLLPSPTAMSCLCNRLCCRC